MTARAQLVDQFGHEDTTATGVPAPAAGFSYARDGSDVAVNDAGVTSDRRSPLEVFLGDGEVATIKRKPPQRISRPSLDERIGQLYRPRKHLLVDALGLLPVTELLAHEGLVP
jgi:hypothetical protein